MKTKYKILIADDDDKNIFALKAVLKIFGYETVTAKNGFEVLRILRDENDINLVLLDMMMPAMDGYETLRKINSDASIDSGIPIFAVTAQAMPGDKEKCLDAGADEYISKPIDMDILLERIKTFLP
jgi:two-component system cell cycle response regulator DivK